MLFTLIFYLTLYSYIPGISNEWEANFYIIHIVIWFSVPVSCYFSSRNYCEGSFPRKILKMFGNLGIGVQ